MKKAYVFLFAIGVLAALAPQVTAQNPPPPPTILTIFREEVKAGRGAAHEKLEAGYVAAFRKAKWNTYSLAMTSLSGGGDAWFMTGYPSLEAWETDRRNQAKNTAMISEFDRLDELDTQFRTSQRQMVARYQEEMSYQANVDVAHMRYFNVITYRVRPGHDAQIVESAKRLRAACEKAKADIHWAVYAVVSGAPSGTYMVFVPMKSLKDMDVNPERQRAIGMALGDEGIKMNEKAASEAYISVESTVYGFSPRMSYVPKEWEEADAAFWKPKPMNVAKAAPKKPAAKTSDVKTTTETKQ
jgi:hypothetical protein